MPDSLPSEARYLVEQLRVLKGRTGLSLAELARRTAYSKSSWQRYLSGTKPPPRGAAQVLARLAGADQARLLALWELADQAWPRGRTVAPAGEPETEVAEADSRWRKAALVAFGVVVLATGVAVVWALPRGAGDGANAARVPGRRGAGDDRAIARPLPSTRCQPRWS
ncbi:helix-turn-helix transcriptional regulator [Streptomyces sp. NPDC046727]|uniref:helix-turn-helix domain-containing protein n=1 Tax=Streptomyces sp. NPDC046727 TaxID=3155373 RepID=UPI0033F862C9